MKKKAAYGKVPVFGDEFSRLGKVMGKLAGHEVLNAVESVWLVEMLTSIMNGDDVSKRFTKTARRSPNAVRNFWIACDVRVHQLAGNDSVYKTVARRWGGLPPRTVEKIAARQSKNIEAVNLEHPGFAAVVEWHRKRMCDTTS